MNLRTIADMPDLTGSRVLVRVDHNVTYDERGVLKDDRKIRVSLPTLELLLQKGAALILMTHVGRPGGEVKEELSTGPIAAHLRTLHDALASVKHISAITEEEAQDAARNLQSGEVLYLENVRFDAREQGNDPVFAEQLASLADYYVNEAFPSLHTYEESSTCGVARLLPSYAGLHLADEVQHLEHVSDDPRRPVVLIVSGAKMKTKIPVIRHFLTKADHILLGGCIANTFIAARGFHVGNSKYEEEYVEMAQELMLESEQDDKAMIHVPRDAVVASEPSVDASVLDLPLEDIAGDMAIFDAGTVTTGRYIHEIEKAGTIVWNGPLGYYEVEQFAQSSRRIADAIRAATHNGAFSVIGGGDTLDLHQRYSLPTDVYSFVSTGGGAMLEFLCSDDVLPGLVPLQDV